MRCVQSNRLIVYPLILTKSQIQVPIDINLVLSTVDDCLHFVTEFFEVISQSAPHIYHSALLLAPKTSIVQKLYGQQLCSPAARVVTGIRDSWDSCSASHRGITNITYAAWSPCGKFIAVCFEDRIGIQDSTTLERVSDLKLPTGHMKATPQTLAFSPDGYILACTYKPVIEPNSSVLFPNISANTHLYTQVKCMCIPLYYCLGCSNRCDHQGDCYLAAGRGSVLQRSDHNHSHHFT